MVYRCLEASSFLKMSNQTKIVGHEAKHNSTFNHVNLSFVWQSVCWTSGFPKSSLEPSTFNQQTSQNITLEPKFWILSLFPARLPSGKIGGFRTRARQMATRCFCPPDKRPPRGPTCVSQPCAWQWLGMLKKRDFDQQYFGHIYQGCFCTPFISLVKTSVAKSSWCQDCQHEAHWKCHFLRSKMGNEIQIGSWENKTETAPGCLVVVNKIQIGHLLTILQVLRRSSLSFFESIQNLTEKVKNTHRITCSNASRFIQGALSKTLASKRIGSWPTKPTCFRHHLPTFMAQWVQWVKPSDWNRLKE